MIRSMRLIPVTADSHPFGTALFADPDMPFVEEEYFFDGTANVYERADDGGKRIRFADAPYTSRLLLRRPASPEAFSGNIIFEIMNSTPRYDLDRCWTILRRQILRDGDIYVGVLSKPVVFDNMKRLDPVRYQDLKWPNPLQYDIPADKLGNIPTASFPKSEDGLYWDILMDTARLLRGDSEQNPLKAFTEAKDIRTILAAWSQSGAYMVRYIRDFGTQEGTDCFDGYFAMGAAPICTPNLNQEDLTPITDQDLHLPMLDRPMIDMHTESDNARLGAVMTRMENGPFYRIYDIAGPSHDTVYSSIEYYENNSDFKKLGLMPKYQGLEQDPNGFPYHFAYQAALVLLKRWIRDGAAPFIVDPIPFNAELENQKENGNSIGGWQLPQFKLAVCEYHGTATPPSPESAFSCSVFGCERPFAEGELERRYGSLEHYRALLLQETDAAIDAGLLLEADREESIERAMRQAEKYGLR